jgi:hypothetical protein
MMPAHDRLTPSRMPRNDGGLEPALAGEPCHNPRMQGVAAARHEGASTGAAANGQAQEAEGPVPDLRERLRASAGEQLVLPGRLGPISPELILVAPPELARLARELLPELPRSYRGPRAEVVPLAPPRAPTARPAAAARGLMHASAAPPYAREQILRGGVAAAVAAVLLAAAAFAADRSDRLSAASPPPAARAAPAAFAKAGVAGVSIARSPGNAPRRHTAKGSEPARTGPAAASGQVSPQATITGSGATPPAPRSRARPMPARTQPQGSAPARARGAADTAFVPSRIFAWAAAPGARAYDVRFFLDGRLVLELRPGVPRLALPASFRFRAGSYRWQVTPLLASGRRGAPVVDSAFFLSTATAATANRGAA